MVVLVVAIVALRHPGSRSRVATAGSLTHPVTSSAAQTSAQASAQTSAHSSAAPTTSARATTPAHSVPAKLPLVVLNNTTTNGLATQAAATFRAGGWTVTDIGNLSNDIISTCAYYDPSVAGAQASAEALRAQFPAIKRVVPKFASLPAGPIVVVLTSDYASG